MRVLLLIANGIPDSGELGNQMSDSPIHYGAKP